jgi:hypothetical protein
LCGEAEVKNGILIIASILFVLFVLSFFAWQYIFSIYEVTVSVSSRNVNTGDKVTIKAIPINSFGKVPPLRKLDCKFEFVEGRNLIQSTKENSSSSITFTATSPGKVVLHVSSPLSLEKNLVEISIHPLMK